MKQDANWKLMLYSKFQNSLPQRRQLSESTFEIYDPPEGQQYSVFLKWDRNPKDFPRFSISVVSKNTLVAEINSIFWILISAKTFEKHTIVNFKRPCCKGDSREKVYLKFTIPRRDNNIDLKNDENGMRVDLGGLRNIKKKKIP